MADLQSFETDTDMTSQLIDSKSNYLVSQYKQFQATDIKGLLQTLRWTNFFLALIVLFLTSLGAFNSILSLSVNLALLYSFCFLFAGILALYELHMKKLGIRIRRNFGFLYTYIGRSIYIFFVSTILFSPQSFLLQIVGIVLMADAFINVFVILVHPAFRKGELKLTDDPSLGYSAGDSEIKNIMVNNPAMAQKMLQGAIRFSSTQFIMSREAFVLPKYVGTNVSFEREPRNAVEYLMSVRKEAETIPDVVTADIKKETETIETTTDSVKQKNNVINTIQYDIDEEWTKSVLEEFDQLRNSNNQFKSAKEKQQPIQFPHINDEDGWFYFCFPGWKEDQYAADPTHIHCRKPKLGQLLQMDYLTTNALFNYHYEWLIFDELQITKDICIWLYALMSLVELPLNSQIASDIRGLYTYFQKYKQNYKKDAFITESESKQILAFIDIILVITGEYFHQNY